MHVRPSISRAAIKHFEPYSDTISMSSMCDDGLLSKKKSFHGANNIDFLGIIYVM